MSSNSCDARRLLRDFGKEVLRAYERAVVLPHHGERALERENVLADLLNHRIPQRYRASRGFLLFENGLDQQQIDCIVYDAFNYGSRSNLAGNVVALAPSVAVMFFETINLNRRKFQDDIQRIALLKKRIAVDKSFDHLSGASHNQPLAFIIAYEANHNSRPWDVFRAYQQEFLKVGKNPKDWRYLPDGVLLLKAGHLLTPAFQPKNGRKSLRMFLNNMHQTEFSHGNLGVMNGPGTVDAADYLFEVMRLFLMRFKSTTSADEAYRAVKIQANTGLKCCFKPLFVINDSSYGPSGKGVRL